MAETTHGGKTKTLKGAGGDRGGARDRRDPAALQDLPRGLLPDQHRDGRAALLQCGRTGRPDRPGASVRPVQRHRHDRPRPGTRRARGGRGGDGRARRGGRDREHAPQRDRQRPLLRGRRSDRDAPAARRGGVSRTSWSSTRHARACPRRSCAASWKSRRNASSTCRATRRRWRPTRARWSKRATT